MPYLKSIILSCAIASGAVIVSGHVMAGNADRGSIRATPHARSWHAIDAGPDGVWAISNEGALYFCRAAPAGARPACSGAIYPE